MQAAKILAMVCAVAALAAPLCGNAQDSQGVAEVIDGDTIVIAGTHIRLFGIDAMERDQVCNRNGDIWSCGEEARRMLVALISQQHVQCQKQDIDAYDREVSVCRVGNTDLAQDMVLAGMALAYTEFSQDYVEVEQQARADGTGIWTSNFEAPSAWRAANYSRGSQQADRGTAGSAPNRQLPARGGRGLCAIKGNHSRRGEWIYHLPGQPYYEATRAEELFCTEEAAQQAGYRPSRAR